MLALVLAPLAIRAETVRAEGLSRVSATVDASPFAMHLFAPVAVVHGCGVIPVIVDVENLGPLPVTVADEHLSLDGSGLRVVTHVGWPGEVIRPHTSRLTLWLLSAQDAGTYIVAAGATGAFDGELMALESNTIMLRVISRCRSHGRR